MKQGTEVQLENGGIYILEEDISLTEKEKNDILAYIDNTPLSEVTVIGLTASGGFSNKLSHYKCIEGLILHVEYYTTTYKLSLCIAGKEDYIISEKKLATIGLVQLNDGIYRKDNTEKTGSIDNLAGLSDKVKTKFSRYSIIFKYLFLLNDDFPQESEKHHDEANAYLHIDALENDRKDKTINDNYYLITPHFLLHIVLYNNL